MPNPVNKFVNIFTRKYTALSSKVLAELQDKLSGDTPLVDVQGIVSSVWKKYDVPAQYRDLLLQGIKGALSISINVKSITPVSKGQPFVDSKYINDNRKEILDYVKNNWKKEKAINIASLAIDDADAGEKIRAIINAEKKLTSIASFKSVDNDIKIINIASNEKGQGLKLINEIVNIAANENKGIYLTSEAEAVGFYEKIGMNKVGEISGGGTKFSWSASEVKKNAQENAKSVDDAIENHYLKNVKAVDGELLSKKINDVTRTDEITSHIRQALSVKGKWQTVANDLVDEGITKAEVPKYIKELVDLARKGGALADDPELVKQYQKAMRRAESQIEKLVDPDRSTLKRAYKDIIELTDDANSHAMEGAIERAVMFKARSNGQRLADTEISRSYGNARQLEIMNDEDAVGIRVTLSGDHEEIGCACEEITQTDWGMGVGVFPVEQLPEYPFHPHCILPNQKIWWDGKLIGACKSFYSGIVIKITTSRGHVFSVTANHPILTSNGWVVAYRLSKRDKVISCKFGKRPNFRMKPNNNKRPPRIKDIFRASKKSSGMSSTTMPASSEDFHGDGGMINGNIDIVKTNGLLLSDVEILINKSRCKNIFNFCSTRFCSFFSNCIKIFVSLRIKRVSSCLMSISDHFFCSLRSIPLVRRKNIGLFDPTPLNVSFYNHSSDNLSTNPIAVRDAILRFASDVAFDNIVMIKMFKYNGHVYDLQVEPDQIYICNGVIVKNCHCILDPVYRGNPDDFDDSDAENDWEYQKPYVDEKLVEA